MKNKKLNLTYIVFGIYLVYLCWAILLKLGTSFDSIPHLRNINLIPFRGSVTTSRWGIRELAYNVLSFLPFGLYISIIKNKWSFFKKVLVAFLLSLSFEIIQYVFAIGASDITDIMNNTFGAIIGILVYAILNKIFKSKEIIILNILGLIAEICFTLLILLITFF